MEIQGSTLKFAKRIVVLEAQCSHLKEEKINLKKQVIKVEGKGEEMFGKYLKVKGKYAKVQEEFGAEKRKWREEEKNLREECSQERVKKRKLEIDLKAAKWRITNLSVELTQKLMAKDEHFQSLLEESNGRITSSLAKNEALDMHTSRLEMESMEAKKRKTEAEEKMIGLVQKIEVLERDKEELEAEICLVNREKSKGIERLLNEKVVVEAEKRTLEAETKKKALELVERINVLEREKRARSEDIKKYLSEKEVLGREKRELEMENREKDERIKVLKQEKECLATEKKETEASWSVAKSQEAKKQKVEVEEKIVELLQKIEALEREKEAEKRTFKAETKKALELIQIIEVLDRKMRGLETHICREKRERSEEIKKLLNEKEDLEREKRELEGETREKDQRIKVLEQENERLAGEKKEMETNRCVVMSHMVITASASCKKCCEPGTKRCKLDGLTEHKLVVKNRRDMFNAFTVNDELCMRSVCTLYRKYKYLGDWKDRSGSPSCKGFVRPFETRGMVLGELLTSGENEGRLKMSLAEFEQADPRGIQDCRLIAWDHYLELFKIYKNKLDPLFIPGNEMN